MAANASSLQMLCWEKRAEGPRRGFHCIFLHRANGIVIGVSIKLLYLISPSSPSMSRLSARSKRFGTREPVSPLCSVILATRFASAREIRSLIRDSKSRIVAETPVNAPYVLFIVISFKTRPVLRLYRGMPEPVKTFPS